MHTMRRTFRTREKGAQMKKTPHSRAYNPIIYEKTLEGEEMHDVFSRLMKERIIFISGEIEQENTDTIIAQLLWLDNQNSKKEISLYISSPGGRILSLFGLYDVIQFIQAPVSTVVVGEASSSAAVLLACGQKGMRLSLPNSQIMIHQPWVDEIVGQVTDVTIQAKQFENEKRKLLTILARHTGQPYEKVEADCERDMYMMPEEALEYGLIDSITTPKKEIPDLITQTMQKQKKRKNFARKQ